MNQEAIPVQLTRMEGVLNLVLERTTTLALRMERVEERAAELESATQRLELDAAARDKTAVALALALKDAEAERRTKTETAWSPFAKVITVIIAAAAILSVILVYRTTQHP